ncbi:MAG TPA: ATP-binding protein [Gemmataceae bacterium]|nr:ATP-binding protein [Gemmataceae bacterium]
MTLDQLPCRLTIPSDLRLLGVARAFVEAVCLAGGLDRTATNAIVLAADEATNNAIRHAHHNNPAAQVQIECYLRPDGIEIHLIDEGEPFNLDAVPDLDPAELRVGGRGIYLMRTLMDEVTCRPHGERGNILRMIKRCPRTPPAASS